MEQFVTLERAIACPRASVAVAAETAAQVLAGAGYRRGLGFGPTSSYVRAYRPVWAVVLAALLAIPTLGLSLFLLRYRTKDHCNVVIEDGPYGVVALVSGRVPVGLPAALEAATGQYIEHQQHAGGYPQQAPPPVLLAPSAGYEGAPSHTPQAILRPATPVPPMGGMGGGYPPPVTHTPPPGGGPQPTPPPAYPGPSFDPYPVPNNGARGAPGPADQQPVDPAPPGAPGPVRPPSRLGPPIPQDPAREQPAAQFGANGTPAPPSPTDDDPFSSTSGRVPWLGGGRPGPLPAPPGPAPVSPIGRPTGYPPAGPPAPAPDAPQPEPSSSPFPPAPGAPAPSHRAALAPGRVATAVSDATPLLRVDNGELLEIGPFCLLGREPVVKDGDPQAQLIRFDDPKLSVSKTHMAYGVDTHGLWVMDRGSTNGTTVIDPTGRRIPCTPGERQYVTPGYQVQIGQRRITVEASGPGAA